MTFDAVAFHESTTNNGLLPVAVAAGEDHYSKSGDDLFVKGTGRILKALFQTAATANFVEGQFGSQDDNSNNWSRTTLHRDQTGQMITPLEDRTVFAKSATLNCNVNHGNNAQVASCLLLLSDLNPVLSLNARIVPDGCVVITGTGVTAAVANTWTNDVATYTYNFKRSKKYAVYGICGYSTTGYAFRIKPLSGDSTYRPGWVLGDTVLLNQWLYSQAPMYTFDGLNPPSFDKLCSGTDSTATRYFMLIKEL